MPWTYVISDLKGKDIVGMFYEKEKNKSKRVELSKVTDLVKSSIVKKMYIVLRSKILKIKYLILLT